MQTDKIHILHLVDCLGMGGAEVMITQIITALGTEKYEHFVYYFALDGPVRQKMEAIGIPVFKGTSRASIKRPVKFVVSLFGLVRDLYLFARSKRIQIIQSHMGPANQLAVTVGKLASIPTFPTMHNTMEAVDRRSALDFRVHLIKLVNTIVYHCARRVVAVSEEVKEITKLKYHLRDSKILVLRNGIVFDDNSIRDVNLEEEFPESSNKLKLVAVGRLTYQKAFEVLVKAVAELINGGNKDIFAMIAGSGEEKPKLEKLIRDLRIGAHIKLLGVRHDIIGLMKASDLFVMPSRFEGLSIAMIEAMACGLPIIASNAPGLSSYIEEGKNGMLFPVEDHSALANCILKFYNNDKLRAKLSYGARKSFETDYDLRNNIEILDTVFQKFCNHN